MLTNERVKKSQAAETWLLFLRSGLCGPGSEANLWPVFRNAYFPGFDYTAGHEKAGTHHPGFSVFAGGVTGEQN